MGCFACNHSHLSELSCMVHRLLALSWTPYFHLVDLADNPPYKSQFIPVS